MKNILSSLNESEKKRILEMHYNTSRQYLMEQDSDFYREFYPYVGGSVYYEKGTKEVFFTHPTSGKDYIYDCSGKPVPPTTLTPEDKQPLNFKPQDYGIQQPKYARPGGTREWAFSYVAKKHCEVEGKQ
jgi:hypothetical protein